MRTGWVIRMEDFNYGIISGNMQTKKYRNYLGSLIKKLKKIKVTILSVNIDYVS